MRWQLLGLVVLVGCKGEPFRPDAKIDGPPLDAYNPPWFHPTPGEITNWDIQISAPYDFANQRQMYVLELFDVVPSARMIDYGDNTPVLVPAGSQAGAIATLQAKGTKVVCHVGTGSIRLTDPDAGKFPGYEANPPNRPNAPAAGSVIGWSTTTTDANERFIDIHTAALAKVKPLIEKRLDLALSIGCDGIAAFHNDAVLYQSAADIGHGFPMLDPMEETQWILDLTQYGHSNKLAVGSRGGHTLASLEVLKDDYDFLMAERCTEVPDCDSVRPFIEYQRAVFGLDYDVDQDGMSNSKTTTCKQWSDYSIDGVIKTAALDGSFRDACN